MEKKLTLSAAILWLAGLAAFIVGLNLSGSTGKWISTAGSAAFLIGLGLEGVLWTRKKKAPASGDHPETGGNAGQ